MSINKNIMKIIMDKMIVAARPHSALRRGVKSMEE